jgi:very-short-patch-repair endonuclease
MDQPLNRVPDKSALDRELDRVLAGLAGRQHGIVARRQLLPLGFSRHEVQDRLDTGRLHRVHRGVYAVGHKKLTLKGCWMASVLACGPEAFLSHRSALALWDLRASASGLIEVTVRGPAKPGPDGVLVRCTRVLTDADVAVVDGIPVTSLAWTVVDFAAIAHRHQVRSVLEALERRAAYIGRELNDLCERTPNRKGIRSLRAVVADMTGPAPWLQSELEEFFRELIRASDLPDYEANVTVEGELVDVLWRKERVIVELDGFTFHKSRARFEADRRRDAKLQVAGYRVLRITHERLTTEPDKVLAEIRALLSAARAA